MDNLLQYGSTHQRGIVQRLVCGSPKPEIVVRFHVPLPRKNDELYVRRFFLIKLPRRLPHMVLDSKANNFMSRFSNLPESFRGQTLSLEGDFNKYFTLYAPKKYERDALYVFTPDVMATLIDAGKDYDMEIIDDNLYVYASGSIRLDSEAELRPLMQSLNAVASKLRRRTDYYADERIGDRAANIVAEPGIRLKPNTTLVTIFFLVFFVIYVITYVMSMFVN